MTQKKYERKKAECWGEASRRYGISLMNGIIHAAFNFVFDRAYALGKQEEDAEGEEMLTVPRMAIIQAYKKCCDKRVTKYDVGYADCLYNLFGSKCLPDETNLSESLTGSEPKPSEPKFHIGQKVRFKGKNHGFEVAAIKKCSDCDEYQYKLAGWKHSYRESYLEPYAEPTSEGTRSFDRIFKDSSRGHNRLHIAAMITASIYSSDTIAKQFNSIEEIVRKALDIADTLIAESEKKHNHGED